MFRRYSRIGDWMGDGVELLLNLLHARPQDASQRSLQLRLTVKSRGIWALMVRYEPAYNSAKLGTAKGNRQGVWYPLRGLSACIYIKAELQKVQ